MSEGDYAVSKHLRLHRHLSLGLVLAGAVIYELHFDSGTVVRHWAVFVFPLALIWYAEQLSLWAIETSGQWLNGSNADVALRIIGWLALIATLSIRMLSVISD
jgi:hypothetical protein